jgi:hypothetical protein
MFVAALCLLVVATAANAATPSPMKPGKWEVSVQMDMPGMQLPAQTATQCITKEQAESAEAAIPRNEAGCKVSDIAVNGNTVSWKVACEAQHLTGEGTLTYQEDSYTGEAQMKIGEAEMKMKYKGKRLGDCEK